ncbi:hypothetical protein O6H91_01G172000 [Diphasiastrum complanatum]|uniref:Uncharacterized protein n=1 Tax=Diphasiastrum complanatum TaxID=34168 RepID=A0ACC2EYU6_DIPCM|nr:hypothetical protein O6H91_01G172000 [Diphasiastrum complanatum]
MSSADVFKATIKSRWMTLAASFIIMACNGTIYAFGIYSQKMKVSLGYTQHELTTIGFFKDFGANFGLVAGILQDYTTAWVVILVGALLNVVGSVMIWLGVTKRIATPTLWQMSLYHFIGFNSEAFINTAVIVTGIKNFPGNRGFVLGLVKGFVGLSGAILAQIYRAVYGDNPTSFILLLLWLCTSVYLLLMFFIRPVSRVKEGNETQRFLFLLGTSVSAALYLLAVILIQKLSTKVGHSENIALAVIEALILLLPFAVVFFTVLQDKTYRTTHVDPVDGFGPKHTYAEADAVAQKPTQLKEKHANETSTAATEAEDGLARSKEEEKGFLAWSYPRVRRGDTHSVLEALLKIEFWMLFIISTSALGTGNMAFDNVGQLGASLKYTSSETSIFVSMISIWNFFGRVSSGFTSEFALKHYSIPRPLFFALSLAIGCVGHLLFAFAVPGALYVGSILVGFAYGFQAPILFIIVSELFGLRFFGTLYNVATLSLPLGTELMSVLVGGTMYDDEARKQNRQHPRPPSHAQAGQSKALLCVGKQCFRNAFLIMAGVSAFACLLSLIVSFRTRKFYKENAMRLTNPPEDEIDGVQLPQKTPLYYH